MRRIPLKTLADSRHNNLNAIRLLLALLVVLSHSFALTGHSETEPLMRWTQGQQTFGSLAVDLFFFISGFLVTSSWLRSKSMSDYLRRRVLRIFPGYVLALVFSFGLAAVFASGPLPLFRHLLLGLGDLVSLGYSCLVGGFIFPKNPVPNQANGSLWTIHSEFYCYLVIAAIGLFGLFKRRILLGMVFAVLGEYYVWLVLRGTNMDGFQCRFLAFFLCGACAWLWRDKIQIRADLMVVSSLLLILVIFSRNSFRATTLVAASYIVLWAGFAHILRVCSWCEKHDLSYGVYLFSFPIQQALVALGVKNPWLLLLSGCPVILGTAFLSWHLFERYFLHLKSRDYSDADPATMADERVILQAGQLVGDD